jgi:hypothetical protein
MLDVQHTTRIISGIKFNYLPGRADDVGAVGIPVLRECRSDRETKKKR